MKHFYLFRKKKKNFRFFYFLKRIKRIRKRVIDYADFALHEYKNPKRLSIKSYGDKNSGKIVYHIKEQGMGYGFFAEFRALLCNLMFADDIGMQPDVFWGESHLYYEKDFGEKSNVYEYFFEPISVENVFESKNVVISSTLQNAYIEKIYGVTGYESTEEFDNALVRTVQKYIQIKPELVEEFETQIEDLFQKRRVLGIHHRGTDYKKAYNGHPVQVETNQVISQVLNIKEKFNIDVIFLATDDLEILNCYQKQFGKELIYFGDIYRGEKDTSIAFSKEKRATHHYLLGKEVLRDAYALSKCTCLVAGKSQVSFFAQIFNKCGENQYEYVEIIDNGLNRNKNHFRVDK